MRLPFIMHVAIPSLAPGDLSKIQSLPYVVAANSDAERNGAPVDTVAATDFMDGLSTWNLDAINVTDFGFDNRQVAYDGAGVYVAVLETSAIYLAPGCRTVYQPNGSTANIYWGADATGAGLAATIP